MIDSPIDKKTSEIIDIVKFLAIVLVCYNHAYIDVSKFVEINNLYEIPLWFEVFQSFMCKVVCRVAVPIFFFLSAFLLYRKNYLYFENLKKKIPRLLVPYIVFNSLGVLVYFVLQLFPQCSVFFTNPKFVVSDWNIMNWINAFVGYETGFPMLYPLWFLRDLIILNLLCDVIKYLIEKFNLKFIFVVGLVYLFINHFLTDTKIILASLSLFYWSLGAYFALNHINLNRIKMFVDRCKISNFVIFYIFGIVVWFLACYYKLFETYFLVNFLILIGCALLWSITYNIENVNLKNILLKLSQYTFPIFLMHEFNLFFLKKIVNYVLPNIIVIFFLEYLLLPIMVILYCMILAYIIKKLNYRIYMVIFGCK